MNSVRLVNELQGFKLPALIEDLVVNKIVAGFRRELRQAQLPR